MLFSAPAEVRATEVTTYTDMHAHLACQEILQKLDETAPDDRCFTSKEMSTSFKFDIYLSALGVAQWELYKHGNMLIVDRLAKKIMASHRVSRAVVLGLDGVIDPVTGLVDRTRSQVYVPNSFVLAAVKRWPRYFCTAQASIPVAQTRSNDWSRQKKTAQC